MTTLTKIIDETIDKAISRGEEPDYRKVTEEVLEDLTDRNARREAVAQGVRMRARYRLRARNLRRGNR